ncbi:MAG: glycosyltransferase [Acidimicrobiia bacterium]
MRIVHYFPDALAGETGLTAAVRQWCVGLQQAGVETELVVDRRTARRAPPPDVSTIRIKHLLRGRLRIPIGLGTIARGADVLVLHSGWVLFNVAAARTATRDQVPYIQTPHGAYYEQILVKHAVRKLLINSVMERRHLSRALAVHCLFPDEERGLAALGSTSPRVLVPHGITPSERSWDGGSSGALLWIGRIEPEHKGLDVLFRALALFPPAERPKLLLRGYDLNNNTARLRTLARDLHLEPWIEIGPPVKGEEKDGLLERAAGFVYPSRWDACPVSVTEALAVGIPTLVTPYPLGRLIASRGGAVLAEASADSIAQGIRRLLSPEGARIGRRGQQLADELSWNTAVDSWLEQVSALMNPTSPTLETVAVAG